MTSLSLHNSLQQWQHIWPGDQTWPPCHVLLKENKKRDLLRFTSLLWCDSVHRSGHRAPTETQSFLTLSPLSHYLPPTIALAQHLSSHCCDSETSLWSFRGEWGISLELRPYKQQEGPFRMGSDGRGATWRGHAWLASPWQPSVFARWSIEGPCRLFVTVCAVTVSTLQGPCYIPPWLARSLAPRLSR